MTNTLFVSIFPCVRGCLLNPILFFLGGRSFEFTEKKEVDKYYPQYYHKIDKVKKNPS